MNYKVVDIPGNSEYNLKGIKLKNGKTCVYWTTKNARQISDVIVFMDNKNVAAINNNQICISLNGIKDIESQRECLKAFCDQLRVMGLDVKAIKFRFIVANKEDVVFVNEMINSLGINGELLGANNRTRQSRVGKGISLEDAKNKKKDIEKKIDNEKDILVDSNISNVVKYDEGVRKDIIVDKDKNVAYDATYDNMSMSQLMKLKYAELMKDPKYSEKIMAMDEYDAVKYIADLVNRDRKQYYMTGNANSNLNKMNDSERATAVVASQNEGVSNNELGIIDNGPSSVNDFSVIESNNGDLREVNPSVSNVGVSNNSTSSGDRTSSDFVEDKKDEREVVQDQDSNVSYYVDSDGKVYNGDTEEIVNGAYCNENNEIIKNGDKIGYNFGNLDDMYKSKGNVRPLTKVYTKPLVDNSNDDMEEEKAGFISFPVIIFIISLILLVSSGIIWFITK